MGTDGRFVIAAVLLHAAAIVAARRMPPRAPSADRLADAMRPVEIEVAAKEPEKPAFGASGAPAPETTRAAALLARASRAAASPQQEATAPAEEIVTAPNASPAPSPAPAPSDGFDPLPEDRWTTPGVIGLSGPGLLTVRGAGQPGSARPAPTTVPSARPTDRDIAGKVLRSDLQKHDKEIGIDLPAAGTVAKAVATVIKQSTTPSTARATFTVRLDASGRVTDVRVNGFTDGSAASWDGAARAVAAQLAGRSLSLSGDYAAGAVVTVEVTSIVQMPSGKKSGRAQRLLHDEGAPVGAESGQEGTLTGRGDLSDIGAHPVRVVSARFTAKPAR